MCTRLALCFIVVKCRKKMREILCVFLIAGDNMKKNIFFTIECKEAWNSLSTFRFPLMPVVDVISSNYVIYGTHRGIYEL